MSLENPSQTIITPENELGKPNNGVEHVLSDNPDQRFSVNADTNEAQVEKDKKDAAVILDKISHNENTVKETITKTADAAEETGNSIPGKIILEKTGLIKPFKILSILNRFRKSSEQKDNTPLDVADETVKAAIILSTPLGVGGILYDKVKDFLKSLKNIEEEVKLN